ncbi:MAG: ABC transporter substrate-binding protein [Lachnospiraceae bacterium]|nr:ABC transporter substrate-binding protein [Lachnospiraceae bacterium]
MKKVLFMALLITVSAAALYGCKGGTKKSGDGSVTVGITQDLDSLDPHKAVAAGTKEVLYNIFEGLVKPDQNGSLVPAVAESYQISTDGTEYAFKLRKGVKFHNGKTVTAEDVIYSLKRCAGMLETSDPEVKAVAALSIISDITTEQRDGADYIIVRLKEANTELIGYLTCSIIPKDYKDQASKPVGTGPFKFVSYTPMKSFVMEKYEDYYGTKAHFDKVTFAISESTDAAFLKLQAGEIDVFPYLTVDQAEQLKGSYNIEVGEMSLVQGLFLNNKVKPFDDPKVRQAMNYAVDKDEILQMLNGGKGKKIGSGVYAGFLSYFNDECTNTYEYNPEKAKQLLKEAGYPDGFTFTCSVPSNYSYHVQTAEILVSQYKKVGITMNIQLIEWASWLSDVYQAHQFESTIIGLDSQLAPSDILKYYIGGSAKNFINYESSEYDRVYKEAMATTDDAKKKELYRKAQQCLADDAASVFLQSPSLMVAVKKGISGYTFYPVYVQDMAALYKDGK